MAVPLLATKLFVPPVRPELVPRSRLIEWLDAIGEGVTKPIDYRTQDFVEVIRQAEPNGIDFVFNGMADEYLGRGLVVLRH